MGCWNETCAISRMSIVSGEAVRFLPIVMNPYRVGEVSGLKIDGEDAPAVVNGKSGCYIGDLWTPLCYPIRGEYNDYGTIEEIPQVTPKDLAEITQFENAFEKYCLPLGVGENEYHDVSIEKFEVTEILEALQEGRCFMNYKSGLPQYKDRLIPISWMMIKESVWQSLLETDVKKSGETWNIKGEPDRCSLKGIREEIVEMMKSSKNTDDFYEMKISGSSTLEDKKKMLDAIRAVSRSMRLYRSRVWNMSPIDKPEVNEELIDVMAEMEYVHSMMSILRINFAPTTGSGSQCDNYKLWKLVNKKWNGIISVELKKRSEEEKKWKEEYKKVKETEV